MRERNPGALVLFGIVAAISAVGVTAWLLATQNVASPAVVLGMGALGAVAGLVVGVNQLRRLWWLGLICGAALLLLTFWRLRDVGVYYLPIAMLLVAMGQALLRERVRPPTSPRGSRPKP